jgi:hypothetical protein
MLALLLVAGAWPGAGHAEPHTRNGWYAGLGYGGNWARVDISGTPESQWAGTLNLRAGYALQTDLLLGAEYTRWSKDYEIGRLSGDIPLEVTLAGAVVAVTYFPGNAGFMLRGGCGVAFADVNVDNPPPGSAVETASPDPGVAALVAVGYEVRVTTRLALGADFNMLYLGVSDDVVDGAFVYGLNLQFNWYW